MSVVYFPAVIEHAGEGYSVFFPDLPGCTSAGENLQDTCRNAEEALSLHLLGMAEDGEPIPTPSTLDQIEIDPEVMVAARLIVRADLPGRKVRVNVMLDEGLISAIDQRDKNRSRFLDHAARAMLSAG